MNRIFTSLYLAIVVSLVLLGWGADMFWKSYQNASELTHAEKTLIEYLSRGETQSANAQGVMFERIPLEGFAQSSLRNRLLKEEWVAINDSVGRKIVYKKISDASIAQVTFPAETAPNNIAYTLFLLLFYTALAVVVYFWVWPLTRDLNDVKKQTQNLSGDGLPSPVVISRRSAIYSLAKSFNFMSERIRSLVSSHKEMTSAVSHELRTPLARMKFTLAVLSPEREDYTDNIKSLKRDIADMDNLISGLLHYAGFEQHNQQLNIQEGDLTSAVEQILERQNFKNISVELNAAPSKAPVFCEWVLMEQCIANLVQNALRFAESKIRVSIITGDECTVIVEDDGSGVPKDKRQSIFNPFFRLPGQKKGSGFGLGLAIVHRLIHWHKGQIVVDESDLGGAKFELKWPNKPSR